MIALEILFWLSVALILWTQLGYPVALAVLARLRRAPSGQRCLPRAPAPVADRGRP